MSVIRIERFMGLVNQRGRDSLLLKRTTPRSLWTHSIDASLPVSERFAGNGHVVLCYSQYGVRPTRNGVYPLPGERCQ